MYGWMEHRVCSYYRVYKNVEQYEWVDRGARAMQKVTGTTGGGLSLGTRCCLVMPYHDCDEEEDDSDDADDVDDDGDNDGDECLHLNPMTIAFD